MRKAIFRYINIFKWASFDTLRVTVILEIKNRDILVSYNMGNLTKEFNKLT